MLQQSIADLLRRPVGHPPKEVRRYHASFLTPPFGWALFYIRGVAPEQIRTAEICRGVVPFVLIQLIGLAILAYNPELATWLPSKIFG